MSKAVAFFRALCCATIALFLAPGLEGFFFPNFDPAKIALTRSSH
jgi:hypothetical protein